MTAIVGPTSLAATGTTGNNSHTSVPVATEGIPAFVFVVEVAGATPTVTYKVQATFDKDIVVDGSANWVDLMILPSDSETAAKTFTVTATGAYVGYLAQANVRFIRRVRVVSSANTNVTYRAELHQRLAP